jgi:hypothetical protein
MKSKSDKVTIVLFEFSATGHPDDSVRLKPLLLILAPKYKTGAPNWPPEESPLSAKDTGW